MEGFHPNSERLRCVSKLNQKCRKKVAVSKANKNAIKMENNL